MVETEVMPIRDLTLTNQTKEDQCQGEKEERVGMEENHLEDMKRMTEGAEETVEAMGKRHPERGKRGALVEDTLVNKAVTPKVSTRVNHTTLQMK